MKIGLAMTARNHPAHPRPLTDVYQAVIEEAVLGEELGFDSWRLAEHHFTEDQHNPSQFPLLAAVATRTERIRLGPYVLLLALHDPIRVAEDAASVDILSAGRLDIAVGAGPMENECAVFGIPKKEAFGRTYEAIEILQRCFADDEFSHHGRYFDYSGVRMTTKPVQAPGPPIYVAAMGPQSLERAGERGLNLASVLHTPLVNIFEQAQEKAGRTRADYRLMSGPVAVHVAETTDRAWDEAEDALDWWIEFYNRRGFDMPRPAKGEMRNTPSPGIFGQPFAVGTPDEVLDGMRKHEGVDLDEIVVQFNHPGMDPAHIRTSMKLFAREIMPEVRTWPRGQSSARGQE